MTTSAWTLASAFFSMGSIGFVDPILPLEFSQKDLPALYQGLIYASFPAAWTLTRLFCTLNNLTPRQMDNIVSTSLLILGLTFFGLTQTLTKIDSQYILIALCTLIRLV